MTVSITFTQDAKDFQAANDVFRQTFEAINSLLGLIGNLFEAQPNQNGTGDVISNDSGFTTLASFQSRQLLGLALKLLDLPTETAYLLYGLRVVLRLVVGYDIVRALRRSAESTT